MSILIALALQSAAAVAAPAPAPTMDVSVSGRIEIGMPVYDLSGGPVGNVFSVKGDTVVVDTGSRKVAFASSVFTMRSGGLVIGLSKADVESAGSQIEQSVVASRTPLLRSGVSVVGADGAPIGSVISVKPGFVLVKLIPSGMVMLPDHSFAGANGRLVMGMTLRQLQELIASR